MDNSLLTYAVGILVIYFGYQFIRIAVTLFQLLAVLFTGAVKWPGPRIHDPNPNESVMRERLGTGYQHLYSTFIWNSATSMAVFLFFLMLFLSFTPLLSAYVYIKVSWETYLVVFVAFIGGKISVDKALWNKKQVKTILSDLAAQVEPHAVDGQSARAEYAIDYPLTMLKGLPSEKKRALDLFNESGKLQQNGHRSRAFAFYQEAMIRDPSLHQNAMELLCGMLPDHKSDDEEGAICYWLGIHCEYLHDWMQASAWYERAAAAYNKVGYKYRESRVRCNLGNTKLQMRDESGMAEFEKAIALNPKNGTAYLNIGKIYYRISSKGDPRHDLALDAFANAILADPVAYGPDVISSLREIGYTWQEDLEEITKRVESKRAIQQSGVE